MKDKMSEENELDEIQLEDSMDDLEIDVDSSDVDHRSGIWVGAHPAEIAASKIRKYNSSSNEAQEIVNLRKDIFTIPLLEQPELLPMFGQLDEIVVGIVTRIINSSDLMRSRILDIIVKVAAGNTYNKNIYEKEESSLEKRPRVTYKDHEILFMTKCYDYLKHIETTEEIQDHLNKPQFIRGVYEEILEEFVTLTKGYIKNHHLCFQARLSGDMEKSIKHLSECAMIENKLQFRNAMAYSIIRDAENSLSKYIEIRSVIIAPYLRSVYSLATKLGKNVQQVLDNFQNGSMGLIRAVSCYSTNRPASFSSVAKGWIKQMMLLSIKEEANFVKLPIATWQAFTAMERVRVKAGLEIEDYEGIAKVNNTTLDKTKSIYEAVKLSQVFSIHKTYDQNEKLTLEDVIPNAVQDSDEEMSDDLRDYIAKADLNPIERKVMALIHGIADIIDIKENHDSLDIEKERCTQLARRIGFQVTFR